MERTRVFHSAYSIVICTVGIFLLISIATFSPNDPPFANYPVNSPVQNYCGKIGASISGWLLTCIGITSYLFAFLVGALGVLLFIKKRIDILWARMIGGILLVVSISPILGILENFTSLFTNPLETGGIIGMIAAFRLTEYLGIPGACILLTLGFLISIMLISNKPLDTFFIWTYKEIRKIFKSKSVIKTDILSKEKHLEPLVEDNTQVVDKCLINAKCETERADAVGEEHEEGKEDEDEDEGFVSVVPPSPPPQAVKLKPRKRTFFSREKELVVPKGKHNKFEDTNYILPPVLLLDQLKRHIHDSDEHVMEKATVLKETLEQFKIVAEVVGLEKGPSVTMYELNLAPGTKVGKIINLSDDIAIALKAPSIRVVAPIPGKSTIGIEVPNTHRKPVQMRELYETASKEMHKRTIPLLLGKDIAGYPLISDLAAMPHLLVAGTTGSGKSVCLNSIILSMLLFQRPEELKLILIDPKMVEFSSFKDIPHLIAPVVTDMKKAAGILEWAVTKMDERYSLLARAGVRDLKSYNKLSDSEKRKRLDPEGDTGLGDIPLFMPCMVIVVDELADLMMVASKEVEASIIRLAQKSRAVGIHLVVATQRPSVDVITGLIKSNLPSRISFHVFSKVDSRTILDQNGAEKLLGKGDMLFLPPGTSKLSRVQGVYVSDDEINRIVDFLKDMSKPEFSPELKVWQGSLKESNATKDELYEEAVRIILETQRGSVSLLQRRLEIGYSRAARLIDLMAEDSIVGEYKGSQAREVFVTLDEWESQQN
ncbi:ATPase FtsK/SpoIIIE and related proteins [Candidatus Scalindua japonica]|uniref:ATPase FtsK/SpoIIIE and related proteins n=1 Tax=Candidatus Scalindua japonica TaxID=1284222 RepID=A0A286TUW6_9BACT|nr:DNA translocase FtsK [Candidatus Scalindua japonica]GAX59641.1 ATPase FtsK/SpoIIIE and related proteins [Candidatus Scalindua japonica]